MSRWIPGLQVYDQKVGLLQARPGESGITEEYENKTKTSSIKNEKYIAFNRVVNDRLRAFKVLSCVGKKEAFHPTCNIVECVSEWPIWSILVNFIILMWLITYCYGFGGEIRLCYHLRPFHVSSSYSAFCLLASSNDRRTILFSILLRTPEIQCAGPRPVSLCVLRCSPWSIQPCPDTAVTLSIMELSGTLHESCLIVLGQREIAQVKGPEDHA